MRLFKPISISLSPNVESDDIWLAFKLLFQPWRWKKGQATKELEDQFRKYLGVKYAFVFNSGRSCLMAISRHLDGEILVQSFTCNATINPILWSGASPVYVDVNKETFNIDVEDLKRKITSNSKAIMVQHTFGIPADLNEIKKIAQENNLLLIEDCAHALGAEYNGQKVGTFGEVAFFSFSRDKIISSVYGGMVVTNDDELADEIKKYRDTIEYPSLFWVKQQLLHPIFMSLILPSYRILGKYILVLFQSIHLMSKAVHWKEKIGEKPSYFPKRMPNALAILALNQFEKLDKFNKHRQEIADFYINNLKGFEFAKIPENIKPAYLRFPIKHKNAHKIIKNLWQKNILIGDWYTSPIAPNDTKSEKFNYNSSTCPSAEILSKITLNLPTHINISEKQAQEIIRSLDPYIHRA
ncbi:aminotransferase class I/II-fold pyridoxal phosphate-dependent enzyme [Patescibacteria group bacterium]|nr:aminotransferase class I/II-fold pyridoxal phosphate-dependent enzyme [Patescibacteria group bacterium]